MNDELSYAEMLEIPVETVTVSRKERKRKAQRALSDQLIDEVNERVETGDPLYAESRAIEREVKKKPREKLLGRILIGEFAAVCVLLATIFLTNLFLESSAINTFVRGLFRGETAAADTRTHADFTLSPIVSAASDAEVEVSATGVLSFTANCAVYPPVGGTLESVSGTQESGYTVKIRHSDVFTTVISGLDDVFAAVGETLRPNIPVAWTDGEGEVRVMFLEDDAVLNCFTVSENAIAWS